MSLSECALHHGNCFNFKPLSLDMPIRKPFQAKLDPAWQSAYGQLPLLAATLTSPGGYCAMRITTLDFQSGYLYVNFIFAL
jgi:hypothetical protein